MTTINSGTPIVFFGTGSEALAFNGETGERLTAAEAEALQNMGGNTAPVGDKLQTKTPQAGEQVKIRDIHKQGGKYYVQDELSNTYEVDKKTYDNLRKGKRFVDGGQLKPTDKKISKFTNKEVDRLKGEQAQARREVQRAASEAKNAFKEQETLAEQKEALKKEYDAARKEAKEAKKALTDAFKQQGGNVEEASLKYKTAKTKFDAVSREYKSCSTHLNNALGKTQRAKTTLENAKTRSAEITKNCEAAKAAEAKATAEAQAARQARRDARVVKTTGGNVPPAEPHTPKAPKVQPTPNAQNVVAEVAENAAATEGAATNTSRAINEASHVKGGGKLGKMVALGAAVVAAGIGLCALLGKKSDDELQEEVTNEVTDNNAQAGVVVDVDDDTANAVDTTTNVPSAGEVEAAQAENAQNLQEIEADTAEANQPIVVQAGDNLWNICRDKLKAEHNGAEPTPAEIKKRVGEMMTKNGLKYEIDGETVLIYPNNELKA